MSACVACFGIWLSEISLNHIEYISLIFWCCASGFLAMKTAALMGLQRFDLIFQSNLVLAVIMISGVLILQEGHQNLVDIFTLMGIACALSALIGSKSLYIESRGIVGSLNKTQFNQLITYAVNTWITTLLWSLVWSRGELPIVRHYLGDDAVAEYVASLTLYGGAVAAVMLAVSGVSPQITSYWGSGKHEVAIQLCRKLMDAQLLISGIGSAALIWLAPELMRIAFGDRYSMSANLLSILALGLPALTLASHNHLLQIITNAKYNRNTTIAGLFFLFFFSLVGVIYFGIYGAALSRAITLILTATMTIYYYLTKWGKSSISVWNISIVMVAEIMSTIATIEFSGIPFLSRLFIFIFISIFLLIFIRDRLSKPICLVLIRMIAPYINFKLY